MCPLSFASSKKLKVHASDLGSVSSTLLPLSSFTFASTNKGNHWLDSPDDFNCLKESDLCTKNLSRDNLPGAQEEMENIRKAYQLSIYESRGSNSWIRPQPLRCRYLGLGFWVRVDLLGMHPDFVGEQQALQNLDNNNYYMQNMQIVMDQQVLQYQTTLASNDPFETQLNTNYYVDHVQLEQPPADSPKQLCPSLWSWQN
ncbi:hypothetical protein ACOSP7_006131 [Xanthoceras sorbifolium]